ncbi:UV DNA damage repair endonuclease UvsE [candidate division KSB1 bacterium]|nr:UV DNA damage repair endonuclease UvsE [candidate division KSB1 bacterium]
MKIGYPCINRSIGCRGDRTFRLASFTSERFHQTVRENLDCLQQMLIYNVNHEIRFFRISSNLIPFASHDVCDIPWQSIYGPQFREIGAYIRTNNIRISMHPGQFTVINSPDEEIVERSRRELLYHSEVLDLMELDRTAKIQIHIGGVYGDKETAKRRFIRNFNRLDEAIRKRLVIENDDVNFTVQDCLAIASELNIPVLFDIFHHKLLPDGRSVLQAMLDTAATWREIDGLPMIDYSSQADGEKSGKHSNEIERKDFSYFLRLLNVADFDVMLEIKDKEASALNAVNLAASEPRFIAAERQQIYRWIHQSGKTIERKGKQHDSTRANRRVKQSVTA